MLRIRKRTIKNLGLMIIDVLSIMSSKNKFRLKYKGSNGNSVFILCSGPSLTQSIERLGIPLLSAHKCFMVNDMAQMSIFEKIRPSFYALSDPSYWIDEKSANERDVVYRNGTFRSMIEKTKWDMTVFVHQDAVKSAMFMKVFEGNKYIKIYPMTFHYIKTKNIAFQNFVYRHNYGTPGANVLCQAIHCSINEGYSKIYLFGADHSWIPDIRVNNQNQVCTIKRHAGEADSELIPWRKVNTEVFTLPEILMAMYYTFDNYFRLREYARSVDCSIYNCTPNSFIDAFERIDEYSML